MCATDRTNPASDAEQPALNCCIRICIKLVRVRMIERAVWNANVSGFDGKRQFVILLGPVSRAQKSHPCNASAEVMVKVDHFQSLVVKVPKHPLFLCNVYCNAKKNTRLFIFCFFLF